MKSGNMPPQPDQRDGQLLVADTAVKGG